jgi:hypothetical protein
MKSISIPQFLLWVFMGCSRVITFSLPRFFSYFLVVKTWSFRDCKYFFYVKYSGPAGYDRLDIRPTRVTTKIFVFTYDQISSYDPRQRQRGEHISYITCSSLRTLAVFALFCRRDHANFSYQSMYSINKYRVTEKGCVSLTARSSINQTLRPAWRS